MSFEGYTTIPPSLVLFGKTCIFLQEYFGKALLFDFKHSDFILIYYCVHKCKAM